MKAGWQTKNLADTCQIFADGDWVESKDQSPKGIRLIQTGNVDEGIFKDRGEKARYISESTFERLRCTEIFEGDCLISRLPDPVGRSCIIPFTGQRMITAVDCTIVRFDSQLLIPAFFNFYSQSIDYLKTVDSATTGTTRNRISRVNLGLVPIPVPPLSEQRRIVAILDEAFGGIARAKAIAVRNLANARAIFESHLNSVFATRSDTWAVKTLEDLAETNCTLSYGIVQPGTEYPNGLPIVRPVDLSTKIIGLGGLKRIDPKLAESYGRTALLGGELLLCVRGSTGAVSIASAELAGANVTRGIVPIRFNGLVNPRFGFYLMSSGEVQSQIRERTYGAALMQINVRDLRKITLRFPLKGQEQIAGKLDALIEETQNLEGIYQQKLVTLDELRQSILQKAFAGDLGESVGRIVNDQIEQEAVA